MKSARNSKYFLLKLLFLVMFINGCVAPPAILSVEEQVLREQKIKELLMQAVLFLRAGDKGNIDRAEAALQLAKALVPEDPRIIDGLGALEFRRGNMLKAQNYFQQALKNNPEYDRAYVHLALVAEKNGDKFAAYQLYKIALNKNPLNAGARLSLANNLLNSAKDYPDNEKRAYEELLMAEVITKAR